MKKIILSFILIILSAKSFGQVGFEKGYFIDNDNRRTECFIKNYDWYNNPTQFVYKTEVSDSLLKGDIQSVTEFGIYNNSKFIRANVNIDRSGTKLDELSYEKNPIWSQEQLFLKVLIEGKASLYSYNEYNVSRFFYSNANSPLQQLIYKQYIKNEGELLANNAYRQQLWTDVKCESTTSQTLERLDYYQKALETYFKTYNKCSGDTSAVDFSSKPKRNFVNLKITPGFTISSLNLYNYNTTENNDFGSNISYRLGLEVEYVLPFNKNKWSVIFEPNYQYYAAEKKFQYYILPIAIRYSCIEFPVGVRYYYSVNDKLRIFGNGFLITNYNINFSPNIKFTPHNYLEITSTNCLAFGGGVDYKKISFEVRIYTNKDLTSTYVNYRTFYPRFSFIFGYKFLEFK